MHTAALPQDVTQWIEQADRILSAGRALLQREPATVSLVAVVHSAGTLLQLYSLLLRSDIGAKLLRLRKV